MSSDNVREWEYFQNKVIPAYIDRLNDLEEQKSDLDVKKKDIIQEMAEQAEKFMQSDEISRFLKTRLKGVVAERTIEEALGEKHKRKYDRYQELANRGPRISNDENTKTIEVSSSGSQNVTGPDSIEQERIFPTYGNSDTHDTIAERSAEIALSTIKSKNNEILELKIRIDEALRLIEDKDKEIERQRLNMGEMEIRIRDLEKKPTESTAELQARYDELKAIEAERTKKQDFVSASQVQSPKQVWVAAINALNFYRELNKASKYAIEHNDPWKKLLFDIASDGQLKVARLEGQ